MCEAEIESISSIKNRLLNAGFVEGEIMPYIGKNNKEKNLISQNITYMIAMGNGDIISAKKYVYRDMYAYYAQKMHPTTEVDVVIDDMLKKASDQLVNINRSFSGNYSNFISKIDEFHIYKNYIICTFYLVGQIELENDGETFFFHSPPEKNIAVSSNYGKTWTYSLMTNYVSEVLKKKFPEEFVKTILQ